MVIETNRVSPNLQDTEKSVKKDVSVPNAMEGRISNYIWDYTKDCSVGRETGRSGVYTEAQAKWPEKETVEVSDEGISPGAFINSCMTGEDFKDLADEETPLEEYTSSQTERAVSRVKKQRAKKKEALEGEVEKQKERQESLDEHLQGKVPLTDENRLRFHEAAAMTETLEDFSEAAARFFIRNGYTVISPEGIQGSVLAADGERRKALDDAGNRRADLTESETELAGLEKQMDEILSAGGLEVTEETRSIAHMLFENDLPVTADHVRICKMITELKEEDPSILLSRIADSMAEGVLPEKADLTKISAKEAEKITEQLLMTDEAALSKTYTTEADFLRAKRQLEEIRLTMTVEAARTMANKGISLDITNLEEIVKELKMQERQAAENLLSETGVLVTEKHVQVMSDTLADARRILAAPVEFLGKERPFLQTHNLQETAAVAIEETAKKLETTYEAVGTKVRHDLGDRIHKAFGNTEDILRDLSLETTEANKRAVRILAYNRMPLTKESILDMKAYDNRVTSLMESLKPPVVAKMIKEQINPLDLTIDELDEKVKDVLAQETPNEDISFRRYLWKMERQKEITPAERESMIGIYRLLDKVEKSDGALIGQVVKEGKELSFSSLLSASRSRRAAGISVEIDDAFGGLDDTVEKGTSISDQIQAAYGSTLVSKLKKVLSPEVLLKMGQSHMDHSLESVLEQCEKAAQNDSEIQEFYEQMASGIREIMEDADGRVTEFLNALEMPDTLANMSAAGQLLGAGKKRYDDLWTKEESTELAERFDRPDALEELYEELDRVHGEAIEKEKQSEDVSSQKIADLAKMAGSISFYRQLRKRQMYEIPLVSEEGITTCHVTIQDGDEKKKGTVEISLETEAYGKIQATFQLSEKRIRGFVTAEKKDGVEAFGDILKEVEKELVDMGFTMETGNPIQGIRRSTLKGNRAEGEKNVDLYRIAKTFIVHVQKERM